MYKVTLRRMVENIGEVLKLLAFILTMQLSIVMSHMFAAGKWFSFPRPISGFSTTCMFDLVPCEAAFLNIHSERFCWLSLWNTAWSQGSVPFYKQLLQRAIPQWAISNLEDEIFRSFYIGNFLKAEFKEKAAKISVEGEGCLGRESITTEFS